MMRANRLPALLLALLLAGCGAVSTQPADPKVTAQIVQACVGSGLFVAVNSTATGAATAIPVVGLAIGIAGQLVNLGVTQVCANPEQYAADAALLEQVFKNLSAISGRQKMMRGTRA